MAKAMQSPDDYEKAFFVELKKMASAGLDVGLWAFFPATNVIGHPIASWFPVLPDDVLPEVHHQCHRTFLPMEAACMPARPPMMIQWTQSHGDSQLRPLRTCHKVRVVVILLPSLYQHDGFLPCVMLATSAIMSIFLAVCTHARTHTLRWSGPSTRRGPRLCGSKTVCFRIWSQRHRNPSGWTQQFQWM